MVTSNFTQHPAAGSFGTVSFFYAGLSCAWSKMIFSHIGLIVNLIFDTDNNPFTMKKYLFKYMLLVSLVLPTMVGFAQGSLMLAGGAGEVAGGWSDLPYRWVVEHAANKRIAVISYDAAATDWIPNYFKSFGAIDAKNILIDSRTKADMQSIYDTLITYDGIFIKGGDQSKYYAFYKGTKTQQALQFVYNKGGVLSGTSAGTAILSPIVYTATVASVDPAAALQNAYTPQITLANDFLNTIPKKYIIDTHFAERGRFGRLTSFLASWYKNTTENAIGIGIDDHTTLCIAPDGKASVFGTGAVGFYYNPDQVPYHANVSMLSTGNMKFTQLIHGCTIDLNNGLVLGLPQLTRPPLAEENARLTIVFSGTDYPSDEAYHHFVNELGNAADAIVIVTGSDVTRASDAKAKMLAKGASAVSIVQAIAANQYDSGVTENITTAKKLFIIANDYAGFMAFINGAGNGALLAEKTQQPGMISFFAGDNARFAGASVVDKYSGAGYTSYHGTLEFGPGLGLLKTTAIMPNAFISTDTYENTVTGLPYAMVTGSLAYGLYLTANTCAEYNYLPDHTSYFKNLSGSSPLIILQNTGTQTGLANQGPYSTSRNIAGFGSMNLKFLGLSESVTTGNNVILAVAQPGNLKMSVFPNPVKDMLQIQGAGGHYSLQLADAQGRVISAGDFYNDTVVNISNYRQGVYLVNISDLKSSAVFTTKFTVIK